MQEFGFDAMGVFKYSPEDGTPAGTMDADPALHVPDEVDPAEVGVGRVHQAMGRGRRDVL